LHFERYGFVENTTTKSTLNTKIYQQVFEKNTHTEIYFEHKMRNTFNYLKCLFEILVFQILRSNACWMSGYVLFGVHR